MDTFRGADKKLGELMLRGWTMLSNSCSVCNCPLMRSPDGQKYCVNCEEWIYDNKKREKKKFEEICPLNNNQFRLQKKEIHPQKEIPSIIEKKEISQKKENPKKEDKKIENIIKNNSNESLIKLMDDKLKKLGIELNNETNIKKCEEIIGLMNKIIGLIENYKKIKII